MGLRSLVLALVCQVGLSLPASADQWGSTVFAHCYELDTNIYQQHLFLRIFWTELGGGQLYTKEPRPGAPRSLHDLNEEPARCLIDGNEVTFETVDYRAPTVRGTCGLCEQTGFRIAVNGSTVWEVATPETLGDPIFNGTIDMDRDMLRVCRESSPETLGVEIPFEQDFFAARTSIMVCQTHSY